MTIKTTEFYPFYDPNRDSGCLGYTSKSLISLVIGGLYIAAQYSAMADKSVFFSQYYWVLGAIISAAIMALYIATDVFRASLSTVNKFEGSDQLSSYIVRHWLSDYQYGLAGLLCGSINVAVAHLLGIPGEFHSSPLSLSLMYVGFFVAGFTAGMGLLAIVAVIALYLKLAPRLQRALDPDDPDGNGGIKKLGDSLWFFAMLIAAVAVLVSIYMLGVKWQYMHLAYVRWIFLLWISLPYLVAISVVLIPGLAVRRYVSHYKADREIKLKQTKAELYSSFKEFENSDDETIISSKKEISEKLTHINDQMEKLRKMRNSHIDSAGDS
ncbi:MAG: hypothetical protein ACJA2Q_000519 [Pseudohongiellaceae bacterium]|jgi:hypothetical protein